MARTIEKTTNIGRLFGYRVPATREPTRARNERARQGTRVHGENLAVAAGCYNIVEIDIGIERFLRKHTTNGRSRLKVANT